MTTKESKETLQSQLNSILNKLCKYQEKEVEIQFINQQKTEEETKLKNSKKQFVFVSQGYFIRKYRFGMSSIIIFPKLFINIKII